MKIAELLLEKSIEDDKIVYPHDYHVKILSRSKEKAFPSFKGELYEKDIVIAKVSRGRVKDGYVPPIEYKFLSSQARNRFDNFSDSLSIEETIEALLPF